MKLQVEIIDGDKTSVLEMDGASTDNELAVINQFFASVAGLAVAEGEPITTKAASAVVEESNQVQEVRTSRFATQQMHRGEAVVELARKIVAKTPDYSPQSFKEKVDERIQAKDEIKESLVKQSRKLPLLGSENRSTFSIGEKFGQTDQQNEKPEHWITGIIVDPDGTNRYKCRYWCDCGKQSNHYIEKGTLDVACHDCGNLIDVEPATKKADAWGVPDRDTFGNFYVARNA